MTDKKNIYLGVTIDEQTKAKINEIRTLIYERHKLETSQSEIVRMAVNSFYNDITRDYDE